MAWALFGALLIGQVGLGSGLLLIGEAFARDACEASCPCDDGVAGAGEGALLYVSAGLAEWDRPGVEEQGGDGLEAPCPPGCDDCTCCPGAVAVILSSAFACLRPALALPVVHPPPQTPVTGELARVFRPPEPCPS